MKLAKVLTLVLTLAVCGFTFAQNSGHKSWHLKFPSPAATSAPAIMPTFIVVTQPQPGTPCFGCVSVNGALVPISFGLSAPLSYIPVGASLSYVLYYQDSSYTGPCKQTYVLKQGTTLITTAQTNFAAKASTVGFTMIGATHPAVQGLATLTGTLTCGTNPAASVVTKLYFQ
ncbi:MAG: hypothetical protein M3O09_09565 [Acidobacteriota bacterium]|nr:hypothetical protein [Acidobacteriota bacterium]